MLGGEFPMAALKRGNDQVSAELIQAGGEILLSMIHKPINSVWNEEELSIIVPVHKRVDKTD
jgi:hypothetical protein